MTYKGSDAHKAAVTGEVVEVRQEVEDDPFKDTSGGEELGVLLVE